MGMTLRGGGKARARSQKLRRLIPFLACFLVVLRLVLETPGMDFISLLLTGGGWRTSFGGLVRHTGSPAALMRIPVMPGRAEQVSGRTGELASQHPLNSSLTINFLFSSPQSSHNSGILYLPSTFPGNRFFHSSSTTCFLFSNQFSPSSFYSSNPTPKIPICFN